MGRPTSKVVLRLDNGELVGEAHRFGKSGNDVVRLTVEEAAALGRVSEKDVDRLRGHVREAAALNGSAPRAVEENGYKTANGKRPGPPEYEVGQVHPDLIRRFRNLPCNFNRIFCDIVERLLGCEHA
jgi:hypothetical protein